MYPAISDIEALKEASKTACIIQLPVDQDFFKSQVCYTSIPPRIKTKCQRYSPQCHLVVNQSSVSAKAVRGNNFSTLVSAVTEIPCHMSQIALKGEHAPCSTYCARLSHQGPKVEHGVGKLFNNGGVWHDESPRGLIYGVNGYSWQVVIGIINPQ